MDQLGFNLGHFIEVLISTIIASSGFWILVSKKIQGRELSRKLLMGLTHDRLTYLCLNYIKRKWISKDEYQNMQVLYSPYKEIGGNGVVARLMIEVEKLPICDDDEDFERSSKNGFSK